MLQNPETLPLAWGLGGRRRQKGCRKKRCRLKDHREVPLEAGKRPKLCNDENTGKIVICSN